MSSRNCFESTFDSIVVVTYYRCPDSHCTVRTANPSIDATNEYRKCMIFPISSNYIEILFDLNLIICWNNFRMNNDFTNLKISKMK